MYMYVETLLKALGTGFCRILATLH